MIKQIQLRGISRDPSDDELWREIPSLAGKYSVSSIGRVRSNIANGGRGKIMAQATTNGYHSLNLFCVDNVRRIKLVHRLVAEAFICPISPGLQVNHINGNKLDNRVENLEIVTPSENCLHAFRMGLSKPNDNGLRKTVSMIRDGIVIEQYDSIRELCRQTKLDRRSVVRVIHGKKSSYNGYTFQI